MAGMQQQFGNKDNLAKSGWQLVCVFTLWLTEWGAAGQAGDEGQVISGGGKVTEGN